MNKEQLPVSELYEMLFKTSPDNTYIVNREGVILNCNHSCETSLGYKAEELKGKKITEFMTESSVETFRQNFPNLSSLQRQEGEVNVICKDNSVKIMWRKGVPLKNKNNEFIGAIIFDRDITARKKNEEELHRHRESLTNEVEKQTQKLTEINTELLNLINDLNREKEKNISILKALPDIIFVLNKEGEFLEYSYQDESLLFKPVREIQGKKVSDILPGNLSNITLEKIGNVLSTGKMEVFDYSLPIKNRDLWFEARMVYKNENEVLIIIRDITEQKKSEELLKEALKKAEKGDKLKSAFLANMSHEIRTPMNSILGFADLLKNVDNERQRNEYIDLIKKSGNELLSIINDILDISKIESGLLTISKNRFNINEELRFIYNSFKNNPKCLSGVINLKFKPGLPDENSFIHSDKTKFNQIVINLVNNAFKYTDEGFVEFGYHVESNEGKLDLVFFVRDTGIGIEEKDKKIIFDRFRQADTEGQEIRGGTGLGLAICKGFIEALGGRIWVESEIGKGSTFYFSLPYTASSIPATEKQPEKQIQNVDWGDKTILIAEDNISNFKLLETYLSFTNAFVLRATNGKMAVKICEKMDNIDLVLMDVKMPEMNGIEATKKIKSFRPDLPVIAQTAYAMDTDKEDCLEAGCDDYISKPITLNDFISILSKYL